MSFPSAFTKSSSSTPATCTLVPRVVPSAVLAAVPAGTAAAAVALSASIARPTGWNPPSRHQSPGCPRARRPPDGGHRSRRRSWRRSTPCSPASPWSGSRVAGRATRSAVRRGRRRPGRRLTAVRLRATLRQQQPAEECNQRHRHAGEHPQPSGPAPQHRGLDGRRRDRVAADRAAGPRRPRGPDRRLHRTGAGRRWSFMTGLLSFRVRLDDGRGPERGPGLGAGADFTADSVVRRVSAMSSTERSAP